MSTEKRVVEFLKATRLNTTKGNFSVAAEDTVETDGTDAIVQGIKIPASEVSFLFREGFRLVKYLSGTPIPAVKRAVNQPMPATSEVGGFDVVPADQAEATGLKINDSGKGPLTTQEGDGGGNFSEGSKASSKGSDGVVMDPNPEAQVKTGTAIEGARGINFEGVSKADLGAIKDALVAVEGYENESRRKRANVIRKTSLKPVLEQLKKMESDADFKERINKKLQ